ncbi:DUF2470 domain-containing protein [Streptomyces sp. TRM 70351]|nr:DUF2470 domain-containing protein [Streptomyces sp. TRM 70351]MEE1929068.1 DUF2470 domain-containing protein [Streptomyces sp. TRM 70351]
MLAIPGAEPGGLGTTLPSGCAVAPDGDVFLLVSGDSCAARAATYARGDDVVAVMDLTDVAPVAVPHRIRGRAQIGGWLTAVPGAELPGIRTLLAGRLPSAPAPDAPGQVLLRLEVGEATVEDLWGTAQVEPEEFAAARPDPLAAHEADLLQHLAAAHGEQVHGLCALLGERAETCATGLRAVPLALDRHGLRVRYCPPAGGEGETFDVHFPFPDPAEDVVRLRQAMHRLFDAADAPDPA